MPEHSFRILFIVISTDIGGAERQAINLAKGLMQQDIKSIHFLSLSKGSGRLTHELASMGIKVDVCELDTYPIHFFKKLPRGLSQLKLFLKAKKQFKTLENRARSFSPTVIIPFTYYPNLVSGIVSRKLGLKKKIWNQRDLGTEGMDGNIFEKKVIRHTTDFIGNSETVINYLKNHTGSRSNTFKLIENSVDLPPAKLSRNEWRKEFGIDPSQTLFLMISNVHPNKDHETVIEAFGLLKDKISDYKVVFVGRKHEAHVEKLQRQIAGTFLQDKILFAGYSDDINGLLQASDVFIFSSKTEGSPNVLLEAMFAQKKIIASAIPPVIELVGKDHAYLFLPGNAEDLAGIIKKIVGTQIPEKILYSGLEKNTIEKMTLKYLSVFR